MGIVDRPIRIHINRVGACPESRRFHTGNIYFFVGFKCFRVNSARHPVCIGHHHTIASHAGLIENILQHIGHLGISRKPARDIKAQPCVESISGQPVMRHDAVDIVIGIGKIGLHFVRTAAHPHRVIRGNRSLEKIPDIVGICLQ
ncbi:hypothetical protein D3C87_1549780 [compost metagenome]